MLRTSSRLRAMITLPGSLHRTPSRSWALGALAAVFWLGVGCTSRLPATEEDPLLGIDAPSCPTASIPDLAAEIYFVSDLRGCVARLSSEDGSVMSPTEIERGVGALAALPNIRGLALVDPAEIPEVVRLSGIRFLSIFRNAIGPPLSMQEVHRMQELEHLRISHHGPCPLDDLTQLAGLRALSLSNLRCSNLDALRGLRNLRRLDIIKGEVTDFSAVDELSGLVELNVIRSGWSGFGARTPNLRVLRVHPGVETPGVYMFEDYDCPAVFDLQELRQQKNVEELWLQCTSRAIHTDALTDMRQLWRLSLDSSRALPESGRFLALEDLAIYRMEHRLSKAQRRTLRRSSRIRRIALPEHGVELMLDTLSKMRGLRTVVVLSPEPSLAEQRLSDRVRSSCPGITFEYRYRLDRRDSFSTFSWMDDNFYGL